VATTSLSMQGDCRGLNDKRRAFVSEYTIHYDSVKAARKVGYKNPRTMGPRLIKIPKVARAIGRIQQRNIKQCILTREDILEELSNFSMSNIVELLDPKSDTFRVRDLRKLPENLQRCIQTFKAKYTADEEGNEVLEYIDCKLVDKLGSIRSLMEHLGMFAPQEHKVQHSLDWDSLYKGEEPDGLDVIEGKISKAGGKK